jgi:hypothetical protein
MKTRCSTPAAENSQRVSRVVIRKRWIPAKPGKDSAAG